MTDRDHEDTRIDTRIVTAQDLRFALAASLPACATAVALVRGPRPRGLWAWLWDRVGLQLARRAGWTVVSASGELIL